MNSTSTTTTPLAVSVDDARDLVEKALNAYAKTLAAECGGLVDVTPHLRSMNLALHMADNVRGWTHTTRLREFLEAVAR